MPVNYTDNDQHIVCLSTQFFLQCNPKQHWIAVFFCCVNKKYILFENKFFRVPQKKLNQTGVDHNFHFRANYPFNLWLVLRVSLDKNRLPNANWKGKDKAVLIVKTSTDPHQLSLHNTRAVNQPNLLKGDPQRALVKERTAEEEVCPCTGHCFMRWRKVSNLFSNPVWLLLIGM